MSKGSSRRRSAALAGGGSVLDLSGVATYRARRRERAAGAAGLESDWQNVGQELRRAMKKHGRTAVKKSR
ncbi:hypothetical protein [Streptomyces sodiiphilus]|uniref:hypothetical protein n=1 Tax=Streptomyces sodiiphilus TaxID=226217 RepID=UPI0031DE0532